VTLAAERVSCEVVEVGAEVADGMGVLVFEGGGEVGTGVAGTGVAGTGVAVTAKEGGVTIAA
jgi:hypothetical protein